MDINEIIKNAPSGATYYNAISRGPTDYYRLRNGQAEFYSRLLGRWEKAYDSMFMRSTPLPTRTKVEYEKVEDKHSITIEQFEYDAVNFYFRHPDCGQYVELNRFTLYEKLRDNKPIYRRIETPITEREEFIEKVGDILPVFDKRTNPMWAGKLYDAGCRFVGE